MRIISGTAKRRQIKTPSFSTGVRPILARVKKSLFDILRPRIAGSYFLDLFAGSGAVGIEALSAGAASVTFVDSNPRCLSVIRQNLSRLQLFDRARLVRADVTRNLAVGGGPFDLIFMGPPYHEICRNRPPHGRADARPSFGERLHLTGPTLKEIGRVRILKEGGWVISQHHAKENPVQLPQWKLFRQESYGDTKLSFFSFDSSFPAVSGRESMDPRQGHSGMTA
ncbi:MAG: RsmD family RNA methyltransferase [Elusimicrobiota bacterium]|jgi:16S rRNA G966 N2-methylase RsmD